MENPFVLPIKTALGYYVYDANNNEILSVTPQLFQYVSNLLADESAEFVLEETIADFKELQEAGYFLPSRVETILHPMTSTAQYRLNRSLGSLVLQVTRNCNLRCEYCIYSENKNKDQRSHSNDVMTFETAKKALDFYREHINDTDQAIIGFYGGEPLLEIGLIKKVVKYAEQIFEGREIHYSLTTNATLLTKDTIDFLLEHGFSTVISLDGPEKIQDRNRHFKDGGGTYQIVMSNLEKYYLAKPADSPNLAINMVIDPEVEYKDLESLLGLPFLADFRVYSSPIEEDGRSLPLSDDYIDNYNYDLFLACVQHFRAEKPVYPNGHIENRLSDINRDMEKLERGVLDSMGAPSGPCIPGKTKLFVDCFGNMYPCEKVNENAAMQIGSLDKGFDLEKIKALLNVSSLNADKCKKCWAFSLCNICETKVDVKNECLCGIGSQHCEDSRANALYKLQYKILGYENEIHSRGMIH